MKQVVRFVFRIVFRAYRVLSWLRYRTYRRFTRAGLALAGGFMITGISGLDTDSSVAYQACVLLLMLLVIAILFSLFFRARFAATRLLPKFGTAGQPLRYRVLVGNLTKRPQRGLSLFENLADPRPAFDEWFAIRHAEEKRSFRVHRPRRIHPFQQATVREAAVPPIPPREQAEVQMQLTPLRRGVLRFQGVALARTDPLGLVRAFAPATAPQSLLILPKRYPLPAVALPGVSKYQQGGVAFSSSVGQSEEFVSLRDYRRGDPLRHIHWRSWAKTGKPIIKEFEDEFFVRHALVLDTFIGDPRSELFEEAVSVAASFACTVLSQESLLDLLFVGPQAYRFTAGRGLAHTDHMLEILASVRTCGDRPFAALETLVLDHAAMVSGCICVLLAWDAPRQELVQRLRALGIPVLVLVLREQHGAPLHPGPLAGEPGVLHELEMGRIEEGLARLA